jgi:putative Mn2+ efflux pump MntP
VASLVASFDHWIAFALLAFVGARMVRAAFDRDARAFAADPSRGASLVILSVATSLDAFAVGLSLAMLRVPVWYPSIVIGVVTAILSLAGLALGSRLGAAFGRRMEAAGGVLLIGVGLHILVTHLRA